jgi:hypothetical protein
MFSITIFPIKRGLCEWCVEIMMAIKKVWQKENKEIKMKKMLTLGCSELVLQNI